MAGICFSPSLGSHSSIPSSCKSVQFLAFPRDDAVEGVHEFEVWTNLSGEWRAHAFKEVPTSATTSQNMLHVDVPLADSGESSSSDYEFTFRRQTADGQIHWLSQAGGSDNGRITQAATRHRRATDSPPLEGGDERASVTPSVQKGVQVVRFPLPEKGNEGDIVSYSLGRLADGSGAIRGLAIEHSKPFWYSPRNFTHISELSTTIDTQLLVLGIDDEITVFFPLSLPAASGTLRGCIHNSGQVWLRAERDIGEGNGEAACVLATGPSYDLLGIVERCLNEAKAVLSPANNGKDIGPAGNQTKGGEADWKLKDVQRAVYCTWNSLGGDYKASQVLERLQALRDAKVLDKFESVLLDDGWQDVSGRVLNSFSTKTGWMDLSSEQETPLEQETSRASSNDGDQVPLGDYTRRKDSGFVTSRVASEASDTSEVSQQPLSLVIRAGKERFPEIRSWGVWMTLNGYWDGINPAGQLSERFTLVKYHRPKLNDFLWSHEETDVYLPDLDEAASFYAAYFAELKAAGVDYVKVDNQADVDAYRGEGEGELRKKLGSIMRTAAEKHFGTGNVINCMSGGAREYNEYLSGRTDPSQSLRTSDDFFPDLPNEHRHHVFGNATTALLDRYLSITRDFDMFFATHPYAEYHAVLRTFSDAALYITDREDPSTAILTKLGGEDVRGEYRIVKAANGRSVRLPGTVFDDVLGHGEGKALKMALPVDETGGVHIGVWNCRAGDAKTADALTWKDLGEALSLLRDGEEYTASKYVLVEGANETGGHSVVSAQDVTEASQSLAAPSKPIAALRLDPGTVKVYTFAPVLDFDVAQIAVFGLVDKYAGLCAVKSVKEVRVTDTPPSAAQAMAAKEAISVAPLPVQSPVPANALPEAPGAHQTVGPAQDEQSDSLPAVTDERTPLLRRPGSLPPSETARASAMTQRRSRMCALLFFWRADLAKLRTSFFRDFVGSPFVTLYKEVRAMLGGKPTNPARDAEDSEPSACGRPAESAVSPPVMMQLGADRILPSLVEQGKGSTQVTKIAEMDEWSGGAERELAPELERERDLQQEETPDMTDGNLKSHQRIVVEATVAGKLAFVLFGEDPSSFQYTLQDVPISEEHITFKGERITIDMQGAVAAISQETGRQGRATFLVGIERA